MHSVTTGMRGRPCAPQFLRGYMAKAYLSRKRYLENTTAEDRKRFFNGNRFTENSHRRTEGEEGEGEKD